jgi:hypothetical protein
MLASFVALAERKLTHRQIQNHKNHCLTASGTRLNKSSILHLKCSANRNITSPLGWMSFFSSLLMYDGHTLTAFASADFDSRSLTRHVLTEFFIIKMLPI